MTTIYNLPEEILLMIFDNLNTDDLFECQTVCRAWYSPARVKLLGEVLLMKISEVEQFIASFDRDPDPLYLKAVKNIEMFNLDRDVGYGFDDSGSPSFQFGKEKLRKLFFRFPKLERVQFYNCLFILDEFDDEICKSFQKVDSFVVKTSDETSARYHNLLKNLRPLITTIFIKQGAGYTPLIDESGGLVELLSTFSRLQTIETNYNLTFQQWITIIERLPNLTTITTAATEDDKDNFAERYLATIPKNEKTQLLKRLANIKNLTYRNSNGLTLNSVKFIAKYMIGLAKLSIYSILPKIWTDSKQLLYCNIISDLAHSIDKCSVEFQLKQPVLQEYLPIVVNKIFQQKASDIDNSPNRCLRLNVKRSYFSSLKIVSNQVVRSINMTCNHRNNSSIVNIANKIFQPDVPLNDVDEFILDIDGDYTQSANMAMYEPFLYALPMLKKISLKLPENFTDTSMDKFRTDIPSLSLLEEITLCPSMEVQCQGLLDGFSRMARNLKQFNFYNFSGNWKDSIGEFRIELGNYYQLETLVIDIDLVVAQTTAEDDAQSFFVVETEFISNSEMRQLFKVDLDLTWTAKIDDRDLKGLTRGEDYIRLHLTLRQLKKLVFVDLQDKRGEIEDLTEYPNITLYT